jgi:hypothetical protein
MVHLIILIPNCRCASFLFKDPDLDISQCRSKIASGAHSRTDPSCEWETRGW